MNIPSRDYIVHRLINQLNKLSNSAMGNIISFLRHTGTLGECGDDTKAIDNSKSALPAMSAAEPGHAGNGLIIGQSESLVS